MSLQGTQEQRKDVLIMSEVVHGVLVRLQKMRGVLVPEGRPRYVTISTDVDDILIKKGVVKFMGI